MHTRFYFGSSAVLAFILLASGCSDGSQASDARVLANMKADPIMGAVMSADPSAEEKVKQLISESADGDPELREDRLRALSEPLVRQHMHARVGRMNDQAVSRVADVLSKAIVAKADTLTEGCRGPVAALVGEDDRRAMFMETAKADPNFQPRTATRQEMAQALSVRIPEVAARSGLSIDQLNAAYADVEGTSPALTCRIMAGSLGVLAAMPPAEGAPLIRAMTKF